MGFRSGADADVVVGALKALYGVSYERDDAANDEGGCGYGVWGEELV